MAELRRWQPGDEKKRPPRKHSLNRGGDPDSIKAIANKQEADQAAAMPGAVKHSNSGAGDVKGDYSVKRDLALDSFMFDSKASTHSGVSLYGKDLAKVCRDAQGQGCVPAITLELTSPPVFVPSRWVAIPFEAFVRLLEDSA